MKHLKLIAVSFLLAMSVGLIFVPTPALAKHLAATVNIGEVCNGVDVESAICEDLKNSDAEGEVSSTLQNVINMLLFGAGIIAVVMIIISGLRFTMSHGDSGASSKARQTLIYSVAGLVIIIMAFAIVNFVIGRLVEDNSGGAGSSSCPNGQSYNATTQQCE